MANISPMLMTRLVGQLTGALRNLRMYNSAHPTSQKLFEASLNLIKEAMGGDNNLSFSLAGNILLLNDKPVPDSRREVFANFISELGKRNIGQLVFLRGLEKDQLQTFYEIMAMEVEQVKAQGGMGALLVTKGVTNIQLEAISYGASSKPVIPEGMTAQDLATLSQMPAQLLSMIRSNPQAVAKLIEAAKEEGGDFNKALSQLDSVAGALAASQGKGTSEYVNSLAGVVGNLDVALQKKVLAVKMADSDWVQITTNMISRLPDADITEMVLERQELLKAQDHPGDMADELKKFWEALPIDHERKARLAPMVEEKLDQKVFNQDERDYILGRGVKPQEYAQKQLELLKSLPTSQVMAQQYINGLRRALRSGEHIDALSQEFFKKLSDQDQSYRLMAINRSMEIVPDFLSIGRYDMIELLIDKLAERLKAESEEDIYQTVLSALEHLFEEMIQREKHAVASRISKDLSELLLYLAEKPVAKDLVRILAKVADDTAVRGLVAALMKDPILEPAAQALANLKEKSLPILMETVKESEDSNMRFKNMYVLNKIGHGVEPMAIKALGEDRWFVRRNMAILLALMGTEASIPRLGETLNDKDVRVRTEVLKAIYKISGKDSEPWLIRALADKEDEVKKLAIEHLSKVGDEASVDALTELYSKRDLLGRGEPPEIKKQIILSLGQIELKSSANFLMKLAKDRDPELAQTAQTALSGLLKKIKPQ